MISQFTVYRQLDEMIEEKGKAALVTCWQGNPGESCRCEKKIVPEGEGLTALQYTCTQTGCQVIEPFIKKERLLLFGGGHVSLALAQVASRTGFLVTVADDRPSFANSIRFACASQVLCAGFSEAIEGLKITPEDYVVIMTRGHRYDEVCLKALNTQNRPYYLGMLGSKKRVWELKKTLAAQGVSGELLERLEAPVGLDIGAVTPEEIAVSIMAQLIFYRRKKAGAGHRNRHSEVDLALLKALSRPQPDKANLNRVVVTVLDTRGSTPRKAGAKMIVYEDGRLDGTIGGGCAEAEAAGRARRLMGKTTYEILNIDMTGQEGEEEAMHCGGFMKVMMESIPENG